MATGSNGDQAPTTWVGSGNLTDAEDYACHLDSGTAYIQLLKNVDTTEPIEFAKNTKTILDLNGKIIDRESNITSRSNVITVNGDLTLCDTSSTATSVSGEITGGYNGYGGGV